MIKPFIIESGSVVLRDRVAQGSVRFEGGMISALDGARDGTWVIDGGCMVLALALVDIHGDAFEHQLMPLPGVMIPIKAALLEIDRRLAANGIATACHTLMLRWGPGLRSVAIGQAAVATLAALAPRLTDKNHVQLRWETFCFEALPLIEAALAGSLLPVLAYNYDTTMWVLHPSVALQDRPFDHAPDFPVVDKDSPAFAAKMDGRAKRSGMDAADFIALMRQMWERQPEVSAVIAEADRRAAAAGAPMFSHDDSQPETRDFYRGHGARISEFPMNMAMSRSAREAGDWIVCGAPNMARGGSHLGPSGAADMVAAGLCDILASDYYPAILTAVARLEADGIGQLPELWKLVLTDPAAALGLADRGEIAVGHRADLVLLDWPEGRTPAVRRCSVRGRGARGAIAAG